MAAYFIIYKKHPGIIDPQEENEIWDFCVFGVIETKDAKTGLTVSFIWFFICLSFLIFSALKLLRDESQIGKLNRS